MNWVLRVVFPTPVGPLTTVTVPVRSRRGAKLVELRDPRGDLLERGVLVALSGLERGVHLDARVGDPVGVLPALGRRSAELRDADRLAVLRRVQPDRPVRDELGSSVGSDSVFWTVKSTVGTSQAA